MSLKAHSPKSTFTLLRFKFVELFLHVLAEKGLMVVLIVVYSIYQVIPLAQILVQISEKS